MSDESQVKYRTTCPVCKENGGDINGDNLVVYTDGWSHCFCCGHHVFIGEAGDGTINDAGNHKVKDFQPVIGDCQPLKLRKISRATCEHFGYIKGKYKGKDVQVAPYYDNSGQLVAQKLRFQDKSFAILGSLKTAMLFGQNRCKEGSKRIVITEGEIDCLSMSQCMDNSWPVVSIPNGAQAAKKAISNQLEFLSTFQEVILMFDNDEPGLKAAIECVELFEPGKCKVAHLPLKDPNEMLVEGRVKELMGAMWNAKVNRPDGIVLGTDTWELATSRPEVESWEYPWPGVQASTLGLRLAEVVTITAGSGVGKSQLSKEIGYHLLEQGVKVGFIALEESLTKTIDIMVGLALNRRICLLPKPPDDPEYRKGWEQTIGLMDENGDSMVCLHDHWGSTDSANLVNKIRYMAHAVGCKFVILDHISIVVSGQEGGDERRMIDNMMTTIGTLARELNIGLIIISHLKRTEKGKGHEEGASTSLSQLRGSGSIGQLSDIVIGAERDQQSGDSNTTLIRGLKNRFTGMTGVWSHLYFDPQTGRMNEVASPLESPSDNGHQFNDEDDPF